MRPRRREQVLGRYLLISTWAGVQVQVQPLTDVTRTGRLGGSVSFFAPGYVAQRQQQDRLEREWTVSANGDRDGQDRTGQDEKREEWKRKVGKERQGADGRLMVCGDSKNPHARTRTVTRYRTEQRTE